MKRRIDLYLCVLLLSLSTGILAQTSSEASTATASKAKISAEARTAFAQAMEAAASLKGLRGAERKTELAKHAARYEEIADRFAGEFPAASRAWYESAEMWRRQGNLAKAEAAYRSSLSKDSGAFRARAIFGIAQMERRQKKFEAAIESYKLVAGIQAESNRANDSRLWIARCWRSLEKPELAMQSFKAAVEKAATPRQVIVASNFLAIELIDRGDFDAADAVLAKAGSVVAEAIDSGAKGAKGLESALQSMSSRRALQKARDKANGSAGDAVQMERDRKKVKSRR